MKRFICIILCLVLCVPLSACGKKIETKPMTEYTQHYLFDSNVTYSDVTVHVNNNADQHFKYYMTCIATVKIFPRVNALFKEASVKCCLDSMDIWRVGGTENELHSADVWRHYCLKDVPIDINGYGETTFFLYCYTNTYEEEHPSVETRMASIYYKSGTVIRELE